MQRRLLTQQREREKENEQSQEDYLPSYFKTLHLTKSIISGNGIIQQHSSLILLKPFQLEQRRSKRSECSRAARCGFKKPERVFRRTTRVVSDMIPDTVEKEMSWSIQKDNAAKKKSERMKSTSKASLEARSYYEGTHTS